MPGKSRSCKPSVELDDFRQGSLSPPYRKCGKPYCRCAKPGSKGHGPLWMVTRAVEGKTVSKAIPKDCVETASSGIVESGCKHVIGARLKQSGKHWTARGANDNIALRCFKLSDRFDTFMDQRRRA